MIIGTLDNTERIEILNPYFKVVFDYLRLHDLSPVSPGKIDIGGENVWISVAEEEGRSKSILEAHNAYVDIQMPLSGQETYGWGSRNVLKAPQGDFDEERDVIFYQDQPDKYITLVPGQFVIFFSEDAHAPCIHQGKFRKLVAKCREINKK